MLLLIIFLGAFSTAKCDGIVQAKTLSEFARQLRAPQPLPIFYNTTKETKITLIKSMSEKGLTLNWINEFKCSKTFLLTISQADSLLDVNEEINIDQQIYFLTPSLDLVTTEMHRIAPSCTELHRVAEPHYSYSYIVTLPKYYSI